LIPALLEGRGDIAVANLTISPERLKQVDFSLPLMHDVKELVITHKSTPLLHQLSDLSGQEIHVRRSSSYYSSLVKANIGLKAAGKDYLQLVPANENLEDEDLLEMLNAGLIPAIVMDSHKAHFWEQVLDNIRIQKRLILRDGAKIGWAFRKNSPATTVAVNTYVQENRKGTLMGNMLLKRYLKDTRYVDNALATKEMKKFKAAAELFRHYAGQYEFDWLMLIAQGYQESRLDQSTRSHAGAVGIMQLLPSTAADKNVGISDIHELENNIHAGAKYMRFIRDRYFSDSDMDEMEQTLFSFAAYNAGPARITRLRKEAAQLGLDPDVWFGNVEVVASKRIGRETVQYVSNIYKYWVAYSLANDMEEFD
jgi:membrane-bound lytic murein transglycosylase MltF